MVRKFYEKSGESLNVILIFLSVLVFPFKLIFNKF